MSDTLQIHPNGYWINPVEGVNHHFDQSLSAAIVRMFNHTESAIDLGCGPGHYTHALQEAGVACWGFDGDPAMLEMGDYFYQLDLTDENDVFNCLNGFWTDLVLCLEVGEHIPREKNRLIDIITGLEPIYVVISWAVPGQGGDGHVWERPNEEVIDEFKAEGYEYQPVYTSQLRDAATLWWFKDTLMVFKLKWA